MCSNKYILRKDIINMVQYSGLFYSINKLNNYYENEERNQINIYNKTIKSVCVIKTIINNTNVNQIGTGIVWNHNGYIVSNYHIIKGTNKIVILLNNKEYDPKVIGYDKELDIVLFKIDNNNTIPIIKGNINDVQIGQNAFAIGNPYNQKYTFTMGIISGKNREIITDTGNKIYEIIQTDATINPGNSGGPLLDSSGKLIGINTASLVISSGINYALPINIITETVEKIIKKGIIKYAIIGVTYLTDLPTLLESQELGIPYIDKGVLILNVPNNSIPFNVGLKGIQLILKPTRKIILGDIIVGIDNYKINNSLDLVNTLEKYKPGDIIKLYIQRDFNIKIFNIK